MKPTELIERLDKVSGALKDATIPEDMDKLQKELERLGLKDEAKQLDEAKWAVWRSAEAFADMWEAVKVKCKLDED